MDKTRVDQYLFSQGLAPSRERARALIMAGLVYLNGEKVDKAGAPVPAGAQLEVRGKDHRYVSRGGLKLEKALEAFPISVKEKICMDVGASTGGFTDCMLQNGASKVYAVDVGYGQLAWGLRCDERVINLERTNIRHISRDVVPDVLSFFSVDVSFISLKHVFPVMEKLTGPQAQAVCLIKPQFEAGREKVGKKGVVREAATHREVIVHAQQYALENGFTPLDLDYSPIKGPEGNIEFLLCLQKNGTGEALPEKKVADVVEQAHGQLDGGKE